MNPSVGAPSTRVSRLAPVRSSLARASSWVDGRTAFCHRLPIRARIALFGAAVVALTVLVFSAVVYVIVSRSLVSQQDNNLRLQGDYVWRLLESGRPFRLGGPSFPIVDIKSGWAPVVGILPASGQLLSTGTVNDAGPVLPDSVSQSATGRRL